MTKIKVSTQMQRSHPDRCKPIARAKDAKQRENSGQEIGFFLIRADHFGGLWKKQRTSSRFSFAFFGVFRGQELKGPPGFPGGLCFPALNSRPSSSRAFKRWFGW
jgi:hypothetical protein